MHEQGLHDVRPNYGNNYSWRYGEDHAQYLMAMEQNSFTTYDRATHVDLTIGATDNDIAYTRECTD